MVKGLYFPGYEEKDAARDMGDSCITETAGIGGFCMAAAPAIVQFVGGQVSDSINYSTRMYEITVGEGQVVQDSRAGLPRQRRRASTFERSLKPASAP